MGHVATLRRGRRDQAAGTVPVVEWNNPEVGSNPDRPENPQGRRVMEGNNENRNQGPAAALAEPPAGKRGRAKVSIAFIGNDKDIDLAAAIARILTAMTGNTVYPSPVPTLQALRMAGDAFAAAIHDNDGGTKAVLHRDEVRETAEELLRDLAAYVQHACRGDLLRLSSSGFPAQRQRAASVTQPIPAPTGVKVSNGNASGRVLARCARVRHARLYQWRYATAQAPTEWILGEALSTVACTLTGLAPATEYLLQVRALGTRGASDWSDIATLIVT
jgi:hypothetical protein